MTPEKETIFLADQFIKDSDPCYKEFFRSFLQQEEGGMQSNNQMFMNFIDLGY